MTYGELVSRISNQLRMLSKDAYISDRYILNVAMPIATKFITQKITRRSVDRDMSLYKDIGCIKFKKDNIAKCGYPEFKNCNKLSKSIKSLKDIGLIFTRYGSTIKELHSIDRDSSVFTESTLYQYRLDSQRQGGETINDKFYILNDHIYIPSKIKVLSGLVLAMDQYELEKMSDCTENCDSFWDFDFPCPDSILADVIQYSVEQIMISKQIPKNESGNLNENEK
jgi:hypothetical protein